MSLNITLLAETSQKKRSKQRLAVTECEHVLVCVIVCVVYSRAVFLVYRLPPIFGRGRALKHVWNSWIETDSEAEIDRERERRAQGR